MTAELLTRQRASLEYGIALSAIDVAIRTGDLPTFRPLRKDGTPQTRPIYLRRTDVDAWISARTA